MTKPNVVLEKWRSEFAMPTNCDDWWTRLRAMDMFLELQEEIYRLQGSAAEPTPPPCKHDQGSGVIDSSGNVEFTCHKCGHVQKFGRGLSENR